MTASIFNLAEYTWRAMEENIQQAIRSYKSGDGPALQKAMQQWTMHAIAHKYAPCMNLADSRPKPKFEEDPDPYKNSPWRGLDELRRDKEWV